MVREGYIEKIIWEKEETGYTVFSVETTEGEEVFVGYFAGIHEGMYIQAEGEYVNHPVYDLQFNVISCELSMPMDLIGIERYLGSGLVKGVGEILAKRIVRIFKEDTLRIMKEEPERLAEVKGISLRKAREIGEAYRDNSEVQEAAIFLARYGIQANLARKIYKIYGEKMYSVLRENPYRLAEDIPRIGFKRADEIAAAVGVSPDSEYRLQSALLYGLGHAMGEGHIYYPEAKLISETQTVMSIDMAWEDFSERAHDQLVEMGMQRKVVLKRLPSKDPEQPELPVVYTWRNYQNELSIARHLADLAVRHTMPDEELDTSIREVEQSLSITLDEIQKQAVRTAICSGVAVITGGPGTGKTTIINALIRYFEHCGLTVELAAPTGRAAKRITESTGVKARTIHRLLEFSGEPGEEDSRRNYFAKNEESPLECDAVIIDETSMLDEALFYALLQAIPVGTRLIMVGDTDQLPSVGAGNVLHDVIASECFPVTTLSTIFRQSEESRIISNAHKIKRGEHIEVDNKGNDFFFIPRNGTEAILKELEQLMTVNLPKYLNVAPEEIQVLTPMRRYELGVNNLNRRLQKKLNPGISPDMEYEQGDVVFREGDKVMQIKNNYKMEWRMEPSAENDYTEEVGVGVFNGDLGKIQRINKFDHEIEVRFDDGRIARYPFAMADELEHAFAITIHKSQGSEYEAVLIPLYRGSDRLLTRNLFYTAVTRARRMVVLVGDMSMIDRMINNTSEQKRCTSLALRIRELFAG